MKLKNLARSLFVNALRIASRGIDRDARFVLLLDAGKALVPEYRFKRPAMAWWDDRAFNEYLDRFGELDYQNTDRRFAVSELLRLVTSVPGDTAECGVYKGSTSYMICSANNGCNRTHHVFDSFEGLSEPSNLDGSHWTAGSYAFELERVRGNLAAFGERVVYHKGWIPERFGEVSDGRFAFVHIDVDLYQPTKDSLEFFYPRMNQGGIIVCDDYGFTSCPGADKAIDEYLKDKPEQMVRLSCGGGFLIKGTPSSEAIFA